jgi:hypothetical protein
MRVTAIPHRWYSNDRNDKSAVLVTFQAWSDTGRGTLIGYLHRTMSVHGVMTSMNMVHAKEWMKMVEKDNLVLCSSEWEPSWFREALTRTEESATRRAAERKPRPIKEKVKVSSPKLVVTPRLRVPKEKKPKLVTSPPREPKEKKPQVILRKRREGFSSLFDEE